MEPNKILSANILDLIFDGRNKEYGAYELRVTYPEQIKKSMIVVFIIGAITIAGAALASSFKPDPKGRLEYTEVTLTDIKEDPKEPEPLPEPIKKPDPPQHTEIYTPPVIVDDQDVLETPPTQDDLQTAIIDVKQQDGKDYTGEAVVKDLDGDKGVIQQKEEEDPNKVYPIVQVPAHYDGDWTKFLTRNLNAETPVENGAPTGRYTILIQFIVDKEGNLSDITPLTSYGFGMEQEAIRVLKKAKGWKAGIQNGHEVNSYHKQPITFIVSEE